MGESFLNKDKYNKSMISLFTFYSCAKLLSDMVFNVYRENTRYICV